MFTGIVEEVGRVRSIEHRGEHASLIIEAQATRVGVAVGDSIAVDGCCLTVAELPDGGFAADLMAATMRTTTLGGSAPGDRVNLERALPMDGRLGGHIVQGHVDGVGEVIDRRSQPGTVFLTIAGPDDLVPYLVAKGSLAVSGVSLTIVDVDASGRVRIGLIPHTLEATSLGELRPGARVNLEVDIIAKYVARLMQAGVDSPYVPDAFHVELPGMTSQESR